MVFAKCQSYKVDIDLRFSYNENMNFPCMICVPIKRKSINEAVIDLKKSQEIADLTEIWFDEIADLDEQSLGKIAGLKSKPLIYKVTWPNKLFKNILKIVDYVDIDVRQDKLQIVHAKKINPKIKLIISFHDFKKTPTLKELEKIARNALSKGADIVKIATTARSFSDTITMIEILSKLQKQGRKAICICMGREGLLTRTAGHLLGNYLMYAPIDKSGSTASGQITVSELRKIQKLTK